MTADQGDPTVPSVAGVNPTTLRAVAGSFATGITIVTCASGGTRHGCVANAVLSVSLEPPLMLVSLAQGSRTRAAIEEAGAFAINILPDDESGRALCARFAGRTDDKFAGARHRIDPTGAPVLDDALGWLGCRLESTVVAGDHTLLIGRVETADHRQGEPLVFFRGRQRRLAA